MQRDARCRSAAVCAAVRAPMPVRAHLVGSRQSTRKAQMSFSLRGKFNPATHRVHGSCSLDVGMLSATARGVSVSYMKIRERAAMALLSLSGDEQRILFTQLCNVLEPRGLEQRQQ